MSYSACMLLESVRGRSQKAVLELVKNHSAWYGRVGCMCRYNDGQTYLAKQIDKVKYIANRFLFPFIQGLLVLLS